VGADIGDAAEEMVWLIEQREAIHPILSIALGETDEVVVRLPVAAGSRADHATLAEMRFNIEPGFAVLAVRRGGRYFYRPRGGVMLQPGDELIASGPDEGRALLAELLGWELIMDEEDGGYELKPLEHRSERPTWAERIGEPVT